MILSKKKIEKKPENGDYKFVKKFAWFPKYLSDGTLVWMCYYKQVWEYKVRLRFLQYIHISGVFGDWDLIHVKLNK